MKKVLVNYGGVVLLYFVIFVGVVLISNKVSHINIENNNSYSVVLYHN